MVRYSNAAKNLPKLKWFKRLRADIKANVDKTLCLVVVLVVILPLDVLVVILIVVLSFGCSL